MSETINGTKEIDPGLAVLGSFVLVVSGFFGPIVASPHLLEAAGWNGFVAIAALWWFGSIAGTGYLGHKASEE